MTYFTYAFLITLNLFWFGLFKMQERDSVICEHAVAAENRRDGWDLKHVPRVIIESLDGVNGQKGTRVAKGVKNGR